MSDKKPLLLIIDTHALAHRAFHAFPADWMTKRGEHTNAIYGFAAMLLQVLKQFKPEYVIAAKDSPGKTFRHDLYPKYKATRPKLDESLKEQLPKISDLIASLKIPVIAQEGYEADDVIGSICKSNAYHGFHKIIVTGDRDLFQVLNGEVEVYLAGTSFSKSVLYDTAAATAKMGFAPNLTVDYKALRGDNSDNIPGVPGIGEKTGLELITKYETLENIYEHIAELKPAVQKKLTEGKELAFTSRQLAQIEFKVPVVLDLDNSELCDLDFNELGKLFDYYEFHSLKAKIRGFLQPEAVSNDKGLVQNANNFDMSFDKHIIKNAKEAKEMVAKALLQESYIVKCEYGKTLFSKPIRIYIAFTKQVYCIEQQDLQPELLAELAELYSSGRAVVYDGKKEQHVALSLGYKDFKYADDLQLINYLLLAGASKADLESALEMYLSIKVDREAQQSLFSDEAGYTQAYQILILKDILQKKFAEVTNGQKWDIKKLYKSIEIPLTKTLAIVERNGIRLDANRLQEFAIELDTMIASVQKEIYALAGSEFNISSPKQLGHVLYDVIQIPTGKKTKGGAYSTNEKVLLNNAANYPIIAKILNYRELFKLKSTYTNALIAQINPDTKRIHTTFNQTIVATGRLSSTEPNLQNIPTSTELGQRIRSAFVADKGKKFVSFDYAQQELRLLAHFSNEEKLINYFVTGHDIHAATAAQLFGVDIHEVTKQQRRIGKTVNFGIVYGISAFGLADGLKIGTHEAQGFIDTFFQSYPKVKLYFDNLKNDARNYGYVETLFGRRRDANAINNSNFQARASAEREIMNFPLQGSAADIIKLAMNKAQEAIDNKYAGFAKMVLQVHDELIFEILDDDQAKTEEFMNDMQQLMSSVVTLNVPVLVSSAIGDDWGQLK